MLSTLTLSYEVRTPDNRFFLPEGTVITSRVMEQVVSEGEKSSHPSYFILKYGTTKKDLLHCLEEPPFDTVFSPRQRLDEVLKLMGHVRLALPVLEFLDYFKENDFHTYSHSLMVFALTTLLAREAVPEYERLIRETIAGSTHDLGKLCVPLNILMKGKPLTQREFSSRPYRPVSFDNRTALEELTDMVERNEFGLDIVRMMISLNRKDKPRYDELKIPAEKRGKPPPGNLYGLVAEDEENTEGPGDDKI